MVPKSIATTTENGRATRGLSSVLGEGEGVRGAILQSFLEGEGELFGDVDLDLFSSGTRRLLVLGCRSSAIMEETGLSQPLR